MSQCKECLEFAVEEMDGGEMVCTSCGSVVDDFIIGSNDANAGQFCSGKSGTHLLKDMKVSKTVSRKRYTPQTGAVKSCMLLIKNIGTHYNLSYDACEEIKSLFMKILPKYKTRKINFKLFLAASCAYVSLSNIKTVLLSDFCTTVDLNIKDFSSVFKKVKDDLPNIHVIPSLEEQIISILRDYPQETNEQRIEHSELVKRTLNIMSFAEKCWLVTGRSVTICIVASAYFAWKSKNVSKYKKYEHFKKLCKFRSSDSTVKKRISEMTDLFVKAAKHLPFIKYTTVDHTNFAGYIDDIIQIPHFIIDSLFAEGQFGKETDLQRYEKLRKKTASKRNLEVIETTEMTSDCGDNELIPDSEWHLYLKTEAEIKCLQDLASKTQCK